MVIVCGFEFRSSRQFSAERHRGKSQYAEIAMFHKGSYIFLLLKMATLKGKLVFLGINGIAETSVYCCLLDTAHISIN